MSAAQAGRTLVEIILICGAIYLYFEKLIPWIGGKLAERTLKREEETEQLLTRKHYGSIPRLELLKAVERDLQSQEARELDPSGTQPTRPAA